MIGEYLFKVERLIEITESGEVTRAVIVQTVHKEFACRQLVVICKRRLRAETEVDACILTAPVLDQWEHQVKDTRTLRLITLRARELLVGEVMRRAGRARVLRVAERAPLVTAHARGLNVVVNVTT